MRYASKKRARELRERAKVIANYEGRPVCARWWAHSTDGSSVAADDAHERLTRARGGSIVDDDNMPPLCRPCHRWVTTHPKEAEAEGLLESAGPRQ